MGRLIPKDRIATSRINGLKTTRLKGHVKITLHDKKTGRNQTIEGENIMTAALPDIYGNNTLGAVDYSKTMPLSQKWLGGILCYKNAFATTTIDGATVPDPADYYPEGDDVNELIAHAGDTAPATAEIVREDYKRGSPIDIIRTENSIKQVWEWDTNQGNGIISALALTHVDTGNAGTGNTSSAFRAFEPFEMIQRNDMQASSINLTAPDNLIAKYDDNHGVFFHIGDASDWIIGQYAASIKTKDITVEIRRLPYSKAGLFETMHARAEHARTFTVTVTGDYLYAQPSWYFDRATKKLWLFTNNTSTAGNYDEDPTHGYAGTWDDTNVHYIVIDCENETITDEGTISSDANNLAPLCKPLNAHTTNPAAENQNLYINAGIAKDGNDIYLPTGGTDIGGDWNTNYLGITGYQRIRLNSSSQSTIEFEEKQNELRSAIKTGGLIINAGRVVNGGHGYTCQSQLNGEIAEGYQSAGVWAFQQTEGPSSLILPIGCGNKSTTGAFSRFIMASKLVHSTKYNLPQAIEKTGTQAMTIEYTLTELAT